MIDIIETRSLGLAVFTAHSERARRWMRQMLGGKVKVAYRSAESASDFRKQARKVPLVLSIAKG